MEEYLIFAFDLITPKEFECPLMACEWRDGVVRRLDEEVLYTTDDSTCVKIIARSPVGGELSLEGGKIRFALSFVLY
ncbi:hypothetical protein NPIL_29131 [Nephila pilipes]|uniref:Uncharacterized protein n=1 Tax=Nephila pilipes TaxID=299642 RepID=A0A8X6NLS2_NEPPI|nr:hypothetical protein NPIL_29131 [Nephila pilipes]